MKLRRCFVPRQLLFLLAAGLATFGVRTAVGEETIVLRNGQTLPVQILGTTAGGIKVQMGAGVMVQPFTNIVQVKMDAPPEYVAARTAYERGDLQTARTNAAAIVDNYKGLPTDWARETMLMLGDIDIGLNQLPQAEADFQAYQQAYPTGQTADVTVGLASIDVAKKDFAAAKAKVDPITAQALKLKNPTMEASRLIGRAYLVSGQIKEHDGDLPGALEDYLRTVAIFPEDRVAAASAQERADAIRKTNGTTVP